MHLLVTGGTGFAMAHVVRQHLSADPAARATVVDIAPPDAQARRFFAGLGPRMQMVTADLTDPAAYATLPADADAVVHGAALTPHRYTTTDGILHWPERDTPLRVIETNIMATARMLDWWRQQPGRGAFVNLSSGSVYAPEVPGVEFVAEDDHVLPDALYDITKYTGERLTRRFAALYERPMLSVRLSSVFGAMDRATVARHVRCIPQRLAMNALAGRPTRVVSAQATGDYVSAADVARAIRLLLAAPPGALHHDAYNIADARLTTIAELQVLLAPLTGGCPVEEVPAATAEITQPAALRTGKYAAYDTARLRRDTGWAPRPLAETLAEYVDWLRAEAAAG
ncbi:MAG: NAD-dependent epimerase/dehydratase family protein [Rhodobacteraceae bacterium]|nr:NAD-dependent epimerase/dehydratase family protein [Paracoccaceae bacterium]